VGLGAVTPAAVHSRTEIPKDVLILQVSGAAQATPESTVSNAASPIFVYTESTSMTMAHANRRGFDAAMR
jgi:hypothetical protein